MCCIIWGYIYVCLEIVFVVNGCCRVDSVLMVYVKSIGIISVYCLC